MAREVQSPDGESWEIGIQRPRLLPKWRGSLRGGINSIDAGGWAMELAELPAIGIAFLAIGVGIIGVSVLGFVVLPVLLFVVELVVLLVAAAVLFPYRWLRGDHTVVARSADGELRWRVGSLREAQEKIDQVAGALESGTTPPAHGADAS